MNEDDHPLQVLLENTDYVARAYSGRGMYGKECLGVVIGANTLYDFIADVMSAMIEFSLNNPNGDQAALAAAEAFRSMKTDAMGKMNIVYFTEVPFVDHRGDTGNLSDEPEEV